MPTHLPSWIRVSNILICFYNWWYRLTVIISSRTMIFFFSIHWQYASCFTFIRLFNSLIGFSCLLISLFAYARHLFIFVSTKLVSSVLLSIFSSIIFPDCIFRMLSLASWYYAHFFIIISWNSYAVQNLHFVLNVIAIISFILHIYFTL